MLMMKLIMLIMAALLFGSVSARRHPSEGPDRSRALLVRQALVADGNIRPSEHSKSFVIRISRIVSLGV
jgi:hypothetical protein